MRRLVVLIRRFLHHPHQRFRFLGRFIDPSTVTRRPQLQDIPLFPAQRNPRRSEQRRHPVAQPQRRFRKCRALAQRDSQVEHFAQPQHLVARALFAPPGLIGFRQHPDFAKGRLRFLRSHIQQHQPELRSGTRRQGQHQQSAIPFVKRAVRHFVQLGHQSALHHPLSGMGGTLRQDPHAFRLRLKQQAGSLRLKRRLRVRAETRPKLPRFAGEGGQSGEIRIGVGVGGHSVQEVISPRGKSRAPSSRDGPRGPRYPSAAAPGTFRCGRPPRGR